MAEAAAKPAGAEVLSVSDLQAWYGESHILHGINFNVKAGEVVTLLGRNGAGKTTTLKSVMGIIGKRTGSIRFNGQDITRASSDSFLFNSSSVPTVIRHATVFDGDGRQIEDGTVAPDAQGNVLGVSFALRDEGQEIWCQFTTANVGKQEHTIDAETPAGQISHRDGDLGPAEIEPEDDRRTITFAALQRDVVPAEQPAHGRRAEATEGQLLPFQRQELLERSRLHEVLQRGHPRHAGRTRVGEMSRIPAPS